MEENSTEAQNYFHFSDAATLYSVAIGEEVQICRADGDVVDVEMKTVYSTADEEPIEFVLHNQHEKEEEEMKNLIVSHNPSEIFGDGDDEESVLEYARTPQNTHSLFGTLWHKHMARGAKQVISGSKLCCLLPLVPLAIVLANLKFGQGLVFSVSLLAIAPLAERLGFVTEQLSFHTSSTVGGLLNATFGNATEMIISVFALRNGMIRVVQLSLLGSILSNMLLVLGCAFFMGGLAHPKKDQKFNKAAAVVSSGLLLMAVLGLLFPAALHSTHTELHDGSSELSLSRYSSCIMLIAYASYLFFQLKSHRQLYEVDESEQDGSSVDEEESVMSIWGGIIWLAILTIFISVLSEYLVNAIEGAADTWNIPIAFISVIILPIVGNAAEHASAIMFALKDKLDISLGVAIGSSTQISMFVIPFCVVVGWIMEKPMDLDFQLYETATLFITVLVVAFMLQEGTANYFKGLMLIFCYMIVGGSFFVHLDQPQHGNT